MGLFYNLGNPLISRREIYLKPFEIAVKSSQPWCLMTSYPSINGVNVDSSKHLLTDVLRNQWGYDGKRRSSVPYSRMNSAGTCEHVSPSERAFINEEEMILMLSQVFA